MLKISNLRFSYSLKSTQLTYDLALMPGETSSFNGPSGCGKSTLLDLIAGFLSPSGGEISLAGKNLVPLPPEQRPVSILFQSNNLFEHLNVEKNLQLGLPKHSNDKQEKLQNALKEVGLQGFMKKRTGDLSGGEKQRVALARTLLRNQPILLLDEPYSSLDRQNADKMRQLVSKLTAKNNWHTLIVSHLEQIVG